MYIEPENVEPERGFKEYLFWCSINESTDTWNFVVIAM